MRVGGRALAALACVALAAPTPGRAMCDVIPGVVQEFRGAVGTLNRPYAIPNDDGEEILVRVRPGVCDPGSPGFVDLPGGVEPEDDYFVTVLFEPPGSAPRNAVVLGTAANQSLCAARVAEAGPLPNGGVATCAEPVPGRSELSIRRECVGGSRSGQRCTADSECPEASCSPVVLRFRFPDTDALLAATDDDRTLTGPATIAVTPVSAPLPVGLAAARCAETPGLVACVDELYARDGTCATTAEHIDPTFGHFTALPPPNDYQALCETPTPPCTGLQDELRFTVDRAGNALIPMDYRGVLIHADRIPVPRLLLGNTRIDAFRTNPGQPIDLPSDAFLASYAPGGQRLPPIFTPLHDPTREDRLSLFGSVDAPVGVIRVQRQGCVGGPTEGAACSADAAEAECGAGGACRELFEFRDRLEAAVGPVLIAQSQFATEAQDPVPLDGLIESESMFAFVSNEAIGEPRDDCDGDGAPDCTRLNDDLDGTDHVLRLHARTTGEPLRIGTHDTEGRAVTRVRDGRFRFPAVAVEGDIVGFLEPELLEGYRDSNGNGAVLETVLRVYRVEKECAGEGPCASPLAEEVPLAADIEPLVDGRSLQISDGRVFFRTPGSGSATAAVLPASGCHWRGFDRSAVSLDGRFQAVRRDFGRRDAQIFLRDLVTGEETLVSAAPDGTPGAGISTSPSISAYGRFVTFYTSATNLGQERGGYLFEHRSGLLTKIPGTGFGGSGVLATFPLISADGRSVVFPSVSSLVAGDTNGAGDVFVMDTASRDIARVSVSFDGSQAVHQVILHYDISGTGRFVAFDSRSDTLVPGGSSSCLEPAIGICLPDDPCPPRFNLRPCSNAYLHDTRSGLTASISFTQAPMANRDSFVESISLDGQVVRFSIVAYPSSTLLGWFERRPTGLEADLNSDGDLNDVILQVLDTRADTPSPRTVGVAQEVTVAAGSAAFLVPQESGPDLVFLTRDGQKAIPLDRPAVSIAMSEKLIGALVPSGPDGETFAEVYDWASANPSWVPTGSEAIALDVVDTPVSPEDTLPTVALLTPGRALRVYRAGRGLSSSRPRPTPIKTTW